MVFILSIYTNMASIKMKLGSTAQHVKLEMYDRLTKTLAGFVIVWVVLAVLVVLSSQSVVPMVWRLNWILIRFWDVLYFGLLVAVRRGKWRTARSLTCRSAFLDYRQTSGKWRGDCVVECVCMCVCVCIRSRGCGPRTHNRDSTRGTPNRRLTTMKTTSPLS